MRTRNMDLTKGTIWKQLLLFAAPLALTQLLQQLYNTVDLAIVGNFASDNSMGAIGSTTALGNLFITFFVGISAGCTVAVAQAFGAGEYKDIRHHVHTAYAISAVGGIVIPIAGYFGVTLMLEAMGTPPEIFPAAESYLRIIFVGTLPVLIYNYGSGILRALGDSRRPLYFLAIGLVVNLFLDLLFVAVFRWDVAGAAWATVISQVITAVLVSLSLMRTTSEWQLDPKRIRFVPSSLRLMLSIGIPSSLQMLVVSLSNVLIQSIVNSFGHIAVKGMAVASKIDGFSIVFIHSIAMAITTFVGQNAGAKRYNRLRAGIRTGLITMFALSAIVAAFFLIFADPIVSIFNRDPEVMAVTKGMISVMLPTYWILGCSQMFANALRGLKKSLQPMLISIFGMVGVRLLWLLTMRPVFNSLEVVYYAYPVSWFASALPMFIYYIYHVHHRLGLGGKISVEPDDSPIPAEVGAESPLETDTESPSITVDAEDPISACSGND